MKKLVYNPQRKKIYNALHKIDNALNCLMSIDNIFIPDKRINKSIMNISNSLINLKVDLNDMSMRRYTNLVDGVPLE